MSLLTGRLRRSCIMLTSVSVALCTSSRTLLNSSSSSRASSLSDSSSSRSSTLSFFPSFIVDVNAQLS
jgi:hypothetical protein